MNEKELEAEFMANYTPASVMPLTFEAEKCIGCNRCVEACQIDVLLPAGTKGKTPSVFWPGECWYCGACVMECPKGAISLRHPLMNQAAFVERIEHVKRSLGGGKLDLDAV